MAEQNPSTNMLMLYKDDRMEFTTLHNAGFGPLEFGTTNMVEICSYLIRKFPPTWPEPQAETKSCLHSHASKEGSTGDSDDISTKRRQRLWPKPLPFIQRVKRLGGRNQIESEDFAT
jgi:hypothetical protein